MRRIAGEPPPWTDDPILAAYRFTNAYRASDRVTQYLIQHVQYAGPQNAADIVFRTLLFKFFNRIETWGTLIGEVGQPSWKTYDFDRYTRVFDSIFARGEPLYSGAYIVPSPPFGNHRKHQNHLRLLEHIMRDSGPLRIEKARSLREVFEVLRRYPSLGDFLAFQFCIDLNYSGLLEFSEMDFVVPGPGARDGIRKCFIDTAGFTDSDIIRIMTEDAGEQFCRLGLAFPSLWGRPLQLIDCQNIFCEVSKYSRVSHPDVKGDSGRVRIKQRFVPKARPLPQWYPPKWALSIPAVSATGGDHSPLLR